MTRGLGCGGGAAVFRGISFRLFSKSSGFSSPQCPYVSSPPPALTMSPSPLSPNVLHVLLQYISPPSQLTHPIPPHLLSKTLLQRHHFLRLTPDTPDEYLCWPSSPEKKAQILELLESRSRPIDDDQPTTYPVQYSFDGEDFFAHVDISPGDEDRPRVILQWDESGEWKYHNVDLMPFPPGSRALLDDVLVPPPAPAPVVIQTRAAPSYFDTDLPEDDEDDYWNAYGSTDIGDSAYSDGVPTSAKDTISSEDAYWAQYASVHGKPSPINSRCRSHGPCGRQFAAFLLARAHSHHAFFL